MKRSIANLAKPVVDRFPKLAMNYRYLRDNWPVFEKTQKTTMGFKFCGNHLMQAGLFEPEETRIVVDLLSYVDVFINVGANVGYYCCIALNQGKHVIAFEPIQRNLRYLLLNITANNWESQAEVYPIALSNMTGAIEMFGGGTGASLVRGWAGTPEHYVNIVPTSTLDVCLGSRLEGIVALILVDIEGSEKLMLEGSSQIINMEPKPIWMVEISVTEHQPSGFVINPNLLSTFHMFWNTGYEARTADKQCRVIHPDEIERIVTVGVDSLHTHNFLFIERGKASELLNTLQGAAPGHSPLSSLQGRPKHGR